MKIYIIWIIAGLAIFSIGRYTAPAKVVTETKIVEKEVQVKHERKHQVKTIVKNTDGSSRTVIITDDIKDQKLVSRTDTDSKTTVVARRPAVNAQILFGNNRLSLTSPLIGGIISKEIIGPIMIGVFGFNNLSGGVAVGLNL